MSKSKVFRISKEGAETHQGWGGNAAFPYGANARATIEDPDGASAAREITSIPSPFARIDLVKTAFKEVVKMAREKNNGGLDGHTIYHKMVSDAFDVGEIFFNIDSLSDKVEIIVWDPASMIASLKGQREPEYRNLGDVLSKYLEADAKAYNFGRLENFYILNYKNGRDELNIIGATSPATLFFSSANDLSYIRDINFANNDRPFDGSYQPLYKRDFEFVKSLFTLRAMTPDFGRLFPELSEYLELTLLAIEDAPSRNALRDLTPDAAKSYLPIDVLYGKQANRVEVIGLQLFKKVMKAPGENAFTIRTNLPQPEGEAGPLVLPVGKGGNKYSGLEYTNGLWNKDFEIPYADDTPLDQRRLPYDGTVYPYLVISDFLEETIVRTDYGLNAERYFDGNILRDKASKVSYLLPLKPLYFKYFSVDDLKKETADGNRSFQLITLAGGAVKAVLRIPIIGDGDTSYIEYERLYYPDRKPQVNGHANEGSITAMDFEGLLMPHVRFGEPEDALYTVSCISYKAREFSFAFFERDRRLPNIPVDCRNKEGDLEDYKAETYTVSKSNFDYIRVTDERTRVSNVLIPLWRTHRPTNTYEFAIDLGTSNTHIEYRVNAEGPSYPFGYSASEGLYSLFFSQRFNQVEGRDIAADLIDEIGLFEKDFIPLSVGEDSDFGFPTRTALSLARTTDKDRKQNPYGMLNLYLTYDKRADLRYNASPEVDIKWSTESNSNFVMREYIRSVMMLVRNKVLAGNGSLRSTKVVWFYPESMSGRRLDRLKALWNEAYELLFNPQGETLKISESVAPIKYYFDRYANATETVNIDIGGGTTDIAFASGGVVKFITSFRFAANALFEDSLTRGNHNNGIIDAFKGEVQKVLKSAKLTELLKVYDRNSSKPANMASFLFSLKDNSITRGLSLDGIDFNRILQADTRFKLGFVVFYTAIIYHIALILKGKALPMPRHIAFSGNGSKILQVLTTEPARLGKFTRTIIETVLGTPYDKELTLLGLERDNNPKEATAKGGILAERADAAPEEIRKLILLDASGDFVGEGDTFSSLDDDRREKVSASVARFYDFVLYELPKVFDYDDNFGVDAGTLNLARRLAGADLRTFLDRGLIEAESDVEDKDVRITDTLSFYPIKGFLQALSTAIYDGSSDR